MKRVALGVRMHSGWGVLVAVSGDGSVGKGSRKILDAVEVADSLEIIDRRRIVIVDATQEVDEAKETGSGIRGPNQPSHCAATLVHPKLGLQKAEKHLADCAAASERLALAAVGEVVRELDGRGFRIVGAAVLLASGRALPSLAKILAAHPLIHTAEGEFFRNAVRKACERLKIPVIAIPERELEERAKTAFGKAASRVQGRIADAGSSIGPPWTKDHKSATLAAAMILALSS